VKILRFNSIDRRVLGFLTLFLLAGPLLVSADDRKPNNQTGKKQEKIHITSDRLFVDSDAKYAKFTGSVRLTQGDMVITADLLKVFFNDNIDGMGTVSTGRDSIKKITASGNVRINMDDGVAVTEQAEFISETGTVILSGENSKVTRGNNSISGTKITLYRKDGRVTVEGGSNKRVEAVIFSGGKGEK
jgi:lipopolysaccharide export system protein LptA